MKISPFQEIIKAKFNFIIAGICKKENVRVFFSLSFKHNLYHGTLSMLNVLAKVLNVFVFSSLVCLLSDSSSARRMRLWMFDKTKRERKKYHFYYYYLPSSLSSLSLASVSSPDLSPAIFSPFPFSGWREIKTKQQIEWEIRKSDKNTLIKLMACDVVVYIVDSECYNLTVLQCWKTLVKRVEAKKKNFILPSSYECLCFGNICI